MWATLLFNTLFLTVIYLPLLVTLSLASLIAQKLVTLVAKVLRPDLTHIFADTGVLFAGEDIYRRPKASIVLHFICDASIDLDRLRAQFDQRILSYCDPPGEFKYQKLRQIWIQFCGFLFWKWDGNFSLNNHIHLYDYTEPELAVPSPCTEADLNRIMGNLISRPYVKGRSPWELLLIPVYAHVDSSSGQTRIGSVLTLKIHHCLADGFSILKLVHRLSPSGYQILSASFPKLPPLLTLLRNAIIILRFPYDLARLSVKLNDDPSSWHVVGKKLSRRYAVFGSDRIPTERIKAIKNKYRVGYNTAVYAITAGAVSRLMKEMGMELPKNMTAFIPFPLPNHPGGLVNHLAGTSFTFSPSNQSPAVRLSHMESQIKDPRSFTKLPTVWLWHMKLVTMLPFPMARLTLRGSTSIVMTSVPGPGKPVQIMEGVRIMDMMFTVGNVRGTTGASAGCVTMAGGQRICLSVDQTILQGYRIPSNFNEFVNQEVEQLLEEVPEENTAV